MPIAALILLEKVLWNRPQVSDFVDDKIGVDTLSSNDFLTSITGDVGKESYLLRRFVTSKLNIVAEDRDGVVSLPIQPGDNQHTSFIHVLNLYGVCYATNSVFPYVFDWGYANSDAITSKNVNNIGYWLNWHLFEWGMSITSAKGYIRKEFLSRINQIYYWRLFCTTQEHYNYLQLIKLDKIEIINKRVLEWPP